MAASGCRNQKETMASLTSEESQGPVYAKNPSGKTFRGEAPGLVSYFQACDHIAASTDPAWAGNIPGGSLALF